VEKASGSGLTTAGEAATLRSHRELLGKLLATRAAALDQATENLRAAEGRLASFPELPSADVAAAIEPIRNAAAAAQARMDALAAQVEALVIRSPVTGTVAAVYSHPGQGVSAGDWILTIAADEAESITGYVPATHRFRPSEGMRVGVRLRVPGSRMVESVVEQVGSQWETMPLELLADPQIPQLALPVRIELPEGLNVLPGEIVDIRFYGSSTGDPSGQPITHGRYGDASREVASRTRRNEEITAECAENAETNRT
jgi:biotin carboxyl carrier protein